MTKFTQEVVNNILKIDDSYKAPEKLMSILFNKNEREKVFKQFLEIEYDVSYDWFHDYFQEEHAQRKTHKQDFTPSAIGTLLSAIMANNERHGSTLDIAAGSGGLTIKKWNEDRLTMTPFEYSPKLFLYHCEELSDRAVPFLLFNMMLRGMNGTVVHGDSLTREVKDVYFVQNTTDDYMRFSDLNVMPRNEITAREFSVNKWIGEPIKNHNENKENPTFLRKEIHYLTGVN